MGGVGGQDGDDGRPKLAELLLLDQRTTTMGGRRKARWRRAPRAGEAVWRADSNPPAKMPSEGAGLPSSKEKRGGKLICWIQFSHRLFHFYLIQEIYKGCWSCSK